MISSRSDCINGARHDPARIQVAAPGILMAALLLIGDVCRGHAVINEAEVPAGGFAFVTLRIALGCGTQPTTEVRMTVPDGGTRVSPRFVPGWVVEKRMRKVAEPYRNELGQLITETVAELVWKGGALPDAYYGELQFRAMMPGSPGQTLWFRTIQNCADGSIRWIELPAAGHDPFALEHPAPFIKLGTPRAGPR